MAATGCVPSLCLFNCGTTSTTESRTHRWEDNRSFMSNGKKWQCDLGENIASEAGAIQIRKAICYEVKL